jgi:hypothetical protein
MATSERINRISITALWSSIPARDLLERIYPQPFVIRSAPTPIKFTKPVLDLNIRRL